MLRSFRRFFRLLGPGLISGAADNDPAGIATYTQVGAQFGYGQLWTALFALPLLTAVQEACARIGLVTGKGLADVIRGHYGHFVLYGTVFILVVTNTINVGADIGAMTEAARLLIPLPYTVLITVSVIGILVLEIFLSYRTYAQILKWLALVQFTYLVTVFVIHEPWQDIITATVVPHMEWSFAFLLLIVGNIGTTIAPYLFFWEASQEAEEDQEHRRVRRDGTVRVSRAILERMRIDNAAGMFTSQLITWSIIVVAATVLHPAGMTDLKTAADAARALEPLLAGSPYAALAAKLLFAIGITSSGLLVIPILSGSAAYALAQAAGWRSGLRYTLRQAPRFYGVIIAATVVGLVVNFFGIDLIKLLVYTSVMNGVAAVPLLFVINTIAANEAIMQEHASGTASKILLWIAIATMVIVVVSAVVSL
jgi:NRAMP (natural resistance-associated macrophage protein)-like metal ion transporter